MSLVFHLRFFQKEGIHLLSSSQIYRFIQNDCRGFNNLYTIHLTKEYMYFFYLIQHTVQVLYMCTLCDSTNSTRLSSSFQTVCSMSAVMVSMTGFDLYLQKGCTYRAPVRYVTKTWECCSIK